ncbi:MAG: class I SAM-dependent methyltransferase [Caulobacteraceae bacterium]
MTLPGSQLAAAPACRICGAREANTALRAREMLHGTREAFDYFECGRCGCVQISRIPEDLARHYPAGYFSFRDYHGLARNPVRRWIDPKRARRRFGGASLIGALAEAVSRPLDYLDWIERAGLDVDARVLDVGCGHGKTLITMALGGFHNPRGVDPFIAATIRYPLGVTIEKTSLEAFAMADPGLFDLVMFHHAFEHLVEPSSALAAARDLLSPRGRIMIVVPVAGSFAWEHYRENWCNLDPPRHLHLFTPASMEIVADAVGLEIEHASCVGALSQFVGSERYARDIAANDPRRDQDLFSRRDLAHWRAETERLNHEGRGDQMAFYLRRA